MEGGQTECLSGSGRPSTLKYLTMISLSYPLFFQSRHVLPISSVCASKHNRPNAAFSEFNVYTEV